MDNKKKQEIFNKINKLIKDEITVSKTEVSENNLSYCITGYLYKGIDLDYSIRKKGEMAICKITAGIDGNDDTNTELVVKELTEPYKMNFTSYDGKYVIQKVISFKEQSDKEAEKTLLECMKTIINMIKDNQEKFVIEYTSENSDDVIEDDDQEETVELEDIQESELDKTPGKNMDIAEAIEEMTSDDEDDKVSKIDSMEVEVEEEEVSASTAPLQRSKHIKRTKIEKKANISGKSADGVKDINKTQQTKNNDDSKSPEKNKETSDNSSSKSLEHIAEISDRLSKDTVKDV